jgi:hypothetical protein
LYLYPSVYKRPHPQGNLYMHTNEELEKIAFELETIGLIQTAQQFPEDVIAAVRAARNVRATLKPPKNNTSEPWPAMRVRETSCTG